MNIKRCGVRLLIVVLVSVIIILSGWVLMESGDNTKKGVTLVVDLDSPTIFKGTLSRNGRLEASCPVWGRIVTVDRVVNEEPLPQLRRVNSFGHDGDIWSLKLADDGGHLAVTDRFGHINVWNLSGALEKKTLAGHESPIDALAFTNDATLLATGGRDLMVKIWDISNGVARETICPDHGGIHALSFTPDNKYLAIGGGNVTKLPDGTRYSNTDIILWDVNHHRVHTEYTGHNSLVTSIIFSPDGRMLASASFNQSIIIWNAATSKIIHSFPLKPIAGLPISIRSLSFNHDGTLLAAAGSNGVSGTLFLFDVSLNKTKWISIDESRPIIDLTFNQDATHLITLNQFQSIGFWDIRSGKKQFNITN